MRFTSLVRFAVAVAVLALAIPALAKPITKDLNLLVPAKVGSTQLEVGKYRVSVDGDKVTIWQGKKVVLETTGQFEEREARQPHNAVLIGHTGQVKEIRFAGDKRVLVISQQ